MFKLLKNLLKKLLKIIKTKQFLYTVGIVLLVCVFMNYDQIFKKENYSSMGGLYGGLGYDASSNFANPKGLYKEDIGTIATRKDFANMERPHLNPILVPIVKGKTE